MSFLVGIITRVIKWCGVEGHLEYKVSAVNQKVVFSFHVHVIVNMYSKT